jgi:hypothetical protein
VIKIIKTIFLNDDFTLNIKSEFEEKNLFDDFIFYNKFDYT